MKKILLVFGLLFSGVWLFGQCPNVPALILSSQNEVDSFPILYPTCEEINAYLVIGDNFAAPSDIVDLSPLSALRRINAGLVIQNNANLSSLSGLDSLEFVGGGFGISDNPNLVSLKVLDGVEIGAGGNIEIYDNVVLESLEGLESISGCGFLTIERNNNLLNLKGLENLTRVFKLVSIGENENLESLAGLESLEQMISFELRQNPNLQSIASLNRAIEASSLFLSNNPQLSVCGVRFVCDMIAAGNASISGNALGCDSPSQVNCQDINLGLGGTLFYDFNQDKILDTEEGGISNQQIDITPIGIPLYTGPGGHYFNYREPNTAYIIDWMDDPDWTLTTDSASYQGLFVPGVITNTSKHFGLFPTFTGHDFEVQTTSDLPRCDTDVSFSLTYQNTGTFIEDGYLEVAYDPSFGYVTAIPIPDFIDTANHILRFDFANLFPFALEKVKIIFHLPGAEAIGEEVEVSGLVFRDDNGMSAFVSETTYLTTIGCSFDPNDKQVFPPGFGEEHFTEKDASLTYTIRFQNTGNLDAINIEIRDTLSSLLDWSTFRVLQSSHEVFTQLSPDGGITFLFPNIFLPAQEVDERGSQGFVRFMIDPLSGLADGTVVENTAHIYFDSNPAIVTNTVFNTYVEEVPTSVEELESDVSEVLVFPNPANDKVTIQRTDGQPIDEVMIFSALGERLGYYRLYGQQLDVSGFGSGLYWLWVEWDGQWQVSKVLVQR